MEFAKASMEDLKNILNLYHDIIEQTPKMNIHARWKEGLHPTEAGIREYIENGVMYLYRDGEEIAGAMAVTMEQGEDYSQVPWKIKAENKEISVIHLLGVNPA